MRPAAGIRRAGGVGAAVRMRLAVGVSQPGAVSRALTFAKALGGRLCQQAGKQRRQADPKGDSPHPVLPGGPGGGVFGQAGEHLGDRSQADRGGEHQEEEFFFQIAHAAEQDFVLLQGVLLGGGTSFDQRVVDDASAAAAGILTRVGVANGEQHVIHIVEAQEDPLRQADSERLQADLAVGPAHSPFERRQAAPGLGAGFFQRGRKGGDAVTLNNPNRRLLVVERYRLPDTRKLTFDPYSPRKTVRIFCSNPGSDRASRGRKVSCSSRTTR